MPSKNARKGEGRIVRARVSYHTEVNLGVIVHRHVDLLLSLGGATVILGRVVVGDRLHGLLDQFVAFVLQTLPVTVFPGIDTAAVVVVLGGW